VAIAHSREPPCEHRLDASAQARVDLGIDNVNQMRKGKLTISIDLELAWGYWDILTPEVLQMSASVERPICAALIELFDRHEIAATWAVVAALLDEASSASCPGSQQSWYAPDIIEKILRAKTVHEIGSHSGKHVYYDKISEAEARDDLDFAGGIHRANGLPLKSFVFPRNAVGHLDLLARAGVQVFRGPDAGWVRLAQSVGPKLGRMVTAADKFLPIPPRSVTADRRGMMVDISGSMLLPGRDGARRFILPRVMREKLRTGLERAKQTGETFHLWFHPCNFYYRQDEQLATLAWFLDHVANEVGHGRIETGTMGSHAASPALDPDAAKAVA